MRQTEIKIQVQPAGGQKVETVWLKETDLAVHSKIPIFEYTMYLDIFILSYTMSTDIYICYIFL